jgi:hypothetical protein
MAISNDRELIHAVVQAGNLLQEIQDYVERDGSKPAQVRFPRGFLRTAAEARRRLRFLPTSHLRSNIAYTMLLSDVQHWLLVRTDLAGTAREMVIKLQLFLVGSIIESITKDYLRGKCGGNFGRRAEYLVEKGLISQQLCDELKWLWEVRNRMHLFQLDNTEWLATDYAAASIRRGAEAFQGLLDALTEAHL